MALAIDSSSPALATGAQTCTTASFTPPTGSLLLIAFSGNDDDWPQFPLAPTITDSLGSHLTYTPWAWQCGGAAGASASSRPSTGHEGQTAFWTASVISSAAMTISVTNNTTLGQSQCAIKVYVITGANLAAPVGASGFDGSTSANAVAQSYTAQIDGGQGFLAVCDWSAVGAQTAGSGCTLDDTWTSGGFVSTAFLHRTIADDANGGLTALNASLPGTSTSLNWSYIEIQPGGGDPIEKDPPPFISFYAPGFGDAPNTLPMPWAGTANVGPDPTGVIVHGSSPETVVNTAGTATGLTTSSFTPPAGSLLLVLWAGNSIDPTNPSAPTITDSLGTPLTYTLADWQSRADTPTTDGQAAAWTAPVITSAPMTVTVNNNAASPNRHADLQVLVLIDANGRPTVGAHGKSGSTSASIITQSYTAQATGGLGFLSMCDWNAVGAPIPGTDCSIVRPGSVGTIPTQISYGQLKRTIPDDVNTVGNRLNVSLPATSTALNWVYIEILPAVVAVGAQIVAPLVLTPPATWPVVPPSSITASQPLGNPAVGTPGPLVVTPAHVVVPPPPVRLFTPTAVGTTAGALLVTPPFAAVPIPPVSITASQPLGNPAVGTAGPLIVSTAYTAKVPGAILSANPAAPLVSSAATPNAIVVSPLFTPVPIPPVAITASQPLGNPAVASPQPLIVTTAWSAKVPGASITSSPAAPVISTTATPGPLVVTPPFTPVPIPAVTLGASQPLGNPATATPQPFVVGPAFTLAPVPGAHVFANPATPALAAAPTSGPILVTPPWQPVPISKPYLSANFPLGNPAVRTPQPLVVGPPQRWPTWTASLLTVSPVLVTSCSTARPSSGTTARPGSGTTAYNTATTARPDSGTTARPNTGQTADPC